MRVRVAFGGLVVALSLPAGCYLHHSPPTPDAVVEPQGLSLARGRYHSCLLDADGVVACWGINLFGQLGVPPDERTEVLAPGDVLGEAVPRDELTPGPGVKTTGGPHTIRVGGLGEVRRVVVGDAHSCALDVEGQVLCWGSNEYGQLGVAGGLDGCAATGAIDPVPCTHVPVRVSLPEPARGLAAGGARTCAFTGDGQTWCWGWITAHLDEGDGIRLPTEIPLAAPVRALAASPGTVSFGHNCAALATGAVQCWGIATEGQLGPHVALGFPPEPAAPFDLPDAAIDVAMGAEHTCALTADGGVYCWGTNAFGELGVEASVRHPCRSASSSGHWCFEVDGVEQPIGLPVRVPGIDDARAVSVRGGSSCALRGDGSVRCWGELGPHDVEGVTGAVALAGDCAVLEDEQVVCFPGGRPATPLDLEAQP